MVCYASSEGTGRRSSWVVIAAPTTAVHLRCEVTVAPRPSWLPAWLRSSIVASSCTIPPSDLRCQPCNSQRLGEALKLADNKLFGFFHRLRSGTVEKSRCKPFEIYWT